MPKEFRTVLSDQLLEKLQRAAQAHGKELDEEELGRLTVEGLELVLERLGKPEMARVYEHQKRR
jgi:hypothetical protein